MEEATIVGLDIGTTKVCALVAKLDDNDRIRILGVGVEPSRGIKKGAVVDLAAATQAITRAIDKAERTSGMEIHSVLVSLSGSEITSQNSRGVVGIAGRVIEENDVVRAMEAAQAVSIPHNREIIHVIQRNFTVDGQEGVRTPVGMHGYRLEVEAHIISAANSTVENLRQCIAEAGLEVTQFVLNPLASAEVVLTETERDMGAIVCDLGGGTTDLAIFIDGDVWHTAVLNVGGNHITSDIAHGLRLPIEQAERIKMQHGHAVREEIAPEEFFTVRTFGEEKPLQVSRLDLAHIVGARVEEIFGLVLQEIKRSGYDGLLPAGMVLTGGSSLLPGVRQVAQEVLGIPVRIGKPENLRGLKDNLDSPAFATSVGLLHWAIRMNEVAFRPNPRPTLPWKVNWERIRGLLRSLLP